MGNSAQSSSCRIRANHFTLMEQFNSRQSECSWTERPTLRKEDGVLSRTTRTWPVEEKNPFVSFKTITYVFSKRWASTSDLLPFFCWSGLVKWCFSSEPPTAISHRKWNFQFDWSRLNLPGSVPFRRAIIYQHIEETRIYCLLHLLRASKCFKLIQIIIKLKMNEDRSVYCSICEENPWNVCDSGFSEANTGSESGHVDLMSLCTQGRNGHLPKHSTSRKIATMQHKTRQMASWVN